MTFDLHIRIESDSPEGHILEDIVKRDHVSHEEAVLKVLREKSGLSPGQQMLGAFSSADDAAMFNEIVHEAYDRRMLDQPRDYGF